jgi:branched-chain amino acid transport system permease protein
MEILQVLFNGIAYGSSLALVAVGLTLVFGVLRIVNFAHGALFMVGAYVTYYAMEAGAGYFVAVLVSGLVVAAISAGLAATVFRRFRDLLLEGAIAAIALALLIENVAFVAFGGAPREVSGPFSDDVVHIGSLNLIGQRLFVIAATIVLVSLLTWFVSRTRYGRALRASQQDPYVARLQGINVDRATLIAFAIGGALAGLAGGLIAPDQVLLPNMGQAPLLLAFVVIIVGGMGSVGGALIAALGVGIVQSAVSTYWVPQAAMWTSFAVVLVFLVFRPRGLFGHE